MKPEDVGLEPQHEALGDEGAEHQRGARNQALDRDIGCQRAEAFEMMERFPETWPAEWLRGHTNQAHWADYWLSFTQPQEVNYAAL